MPPSAQCAPRRSGSGSGTRFPGAGGATVPVRDFHIRKTDRDSGAVPRPRSGISVPNMDLNRPVLGLALLTLLVLVPAGTGADLDCTNAFEDEMFCQMNAENCAEHNLTLRGGFQEKFCVFQECDTGQCCCSVKMTTYYQDKVEATVRKGSLTVESKVVDIIDSIKPKAPTIVSVKESKGVLEVKWKDNYNGNYFSESLSATVTYHKKGDTEKFSEHADRIFVDGFRYYSGKCLEPNTAYVVSVRSYSSWNEKLGDSSEDREFTTGNVQDACSQFSWSWMIIVSLCVFAVILTGAAFGCYVKLKSKWWDTVASPKLLIHPNHPEFLKPEPLSISSVCVVPPVPDDCKPWLKGLLTDSSSSSSENTRQSSGISTGSSCLSYANAEPANVIAGVHDALCKALPNISPISPLTTSPFLETTKDSGFFSVLSNPCGAVDVNSGFDNKSYSIFIPSSMQQDATDSPEVQPQAEMACESAYRPSEGDTSACAEQQAPVCPLFTSPLQAAPLVPTDMSYHQCNAESGLSSTAHDPEAARASFDELVKRAEHPNGMSFLQVDDSYQAFRNVLGQPDASFPPPLSGGNQEHLDRFPQESFAKIPVVLPGFMNNVHGGQCRPELQRPLISLMSAHVPVITESGYQSV